MNNNNNNNVFKKVDKVKFFVNVNKALIQIFRTRH